MEGAGEDIALLRALKRSVAFTKGAPKSVKGVVVPRPSAMVVASMKAVAPYAAFEINVGRLGEGGIQKLLSSEVMLRSAQVHERFQPSMHTIIRSSICNDGDDPKKKSLKSSASSPIVIPWI